MLKPHRKPYGYKELLVYKKSEALQDETERVTSYFPKKKTLVALADQMNRSTRSAKQNIVEGWKRNSTREYFDFLGFAIGSNTELEEDCNDVLKGFYPDLMGIKGIMGERRMGERGNLSSHPSPRHSSTLQPHPSPQSPSSHSTLSIPFSLRTPSPHSTPFSLSEIEKIPFYPLDPSLAPIIRLKLRSKELNFLLSQLQNSLEQKMQNENTFAAKDKLKLHEQQIQKEKDFEKELQEKYLNPLGKN